MLCLPMAAKADKLQTFLKKALNSMFQSVGFSSFDPEFARRPDWYCRKQWTEKERQEFRKWFVASGRKDLGWSKGVAEREFALFDLMWGWKTSHTDRRRAKV